MRIVCLLQVRNEVTTGHLRRFLDLNSELFDALYVFDDQSDDGTFEELTKFGAKVFRWTHRAFGNELLAKNYVLDKIGSSETPDTWILRLDADEVIFASRQQLEALICEAKDAGFTGITLGNLNLWKSTQFCRLDDQFDSFQPVRMWLNQPQVRFPKKTGLHVTSDPLGLARVMVSNRFPTFHFGFATTDLILKKALTYWSFGQRGYPLFRLLLDADRKVANVSELQIDVGERWEGWIEHNRTDIEPADDMSSLVQFNSQRVPTDINPKVTLLCLIYQGLEWLEMAYGELIKLSREFSAGEVEILFIANDATEEVVTFLVENHIPHRVFSGRNRPDEWYINSVYRAYNFGVSQAKGERVLLVNSDMIFSEGFLANLMASHTQEMLLTAKLIESGRLSPGTNAIAKDLGSTPKNLRRADFHRLVRLSSQNSLESGGLYMPLLVQRKAFLELGGFPEGNLVPETLDDYLRGEAPKYAISGQPCIPGDEALFAKARAQGFVHMTSQMSFCYHFQEGERRQSKKHRRLSSVNSGIGIVNDTISGLNGETVFWEELRGRLEGLQYRVVSSEGARPNSILSDIILPLKLFLLTEIRFRTGNRPRVIFQNGTYSLPLKGNNMVALVQDRPKTFRNRILQRLVQARASVTITNDLSYFQKRKGVKSLWLPLPLSEVWSPSGISKREVGNTHVGQVNACFVGALNDTKGWPELKDLISQSPDFNWTVVSKFSQESLFSQSDFGAARPAFFSNLDAASLKQVLQSQDVLVVTSPHETQHLASLEALSQGVRVVTTPTGFLGSYPLGTYEWGEVLEAPDRDAITRAANLTFDPRSVMVNLGLTSDAIWGLWEEFFNEQVENSFLTMTRLPFLARFAGRARSAMLNIGRRWIRAALSWFSRLRVIQVLAQLRKS